MKDWTHLMKREDTGEAIRVRVNDLGEVFTQTLTSGSYVDSTWDRKYRERLGWVFEPRPEPTIREQIEALPVGTRIEITDDEGDSKMLYCRAEGLGTYDEYSSRGDWSEFPDVVSFTVLVPQGEAHGDASRTQGDA